MADLALPAPHEILAPKVRDLFFDDDGNYIPSDFKVMYGGRAGLKSWGFCRVAVMLATQVPKLRIACGREYQSSIEESVHATIVTQIEELRLQRYFAVTKRAITSFNGCRFFFAGLKTEPAKFKSTESIDILIIEEGEKVSKDSWQKIIPTIRKPGAEIWCGFNPDLPGDETSRMFITDPKMRALMTFPGGTDPGAMPNARIVETSWRDNLWLSEKLRRDKDYLASVDADAYQHVWEGKFRQNSAAQIFKGKYRIEAFTPGKDWQGPFQGTDWGFSQDPTVLVRCWVSGLRLYIEHEAYAIGRDIDTTPQLFDQVGEKESARKHVTRADNARPETVRYLQTHGYPRMLSVEKWSGSVEDGIAFLRQFEVIVIHPRCVHAAEEALLYSYKVEKLTGDVTTEIVDKHNHVWDAVRYALQPLIRAPNTGFLTFMQQQVEAMNQRKAAEAAGSSQ